MEQFTGHSCVRLLGTVNLVATCHRESQKSHAHLSSRIITSCSIESRQNLGTILGTIAVFVSHCYCTSFFLLCLLCLLSKENRVYTLRSTHFCTIAIRPRGTQGHNIFFSILPDGDSIGTIDTAHEVHAPNSMIVLTFNTSLHHVVLSQAPETRLAQCTKTRLNVTCSIINSLKRYTIMTIKTLKQGTIKSRSQRAINKAAKQQLHNNLRSIDMMLAREGILEALQPHAPVIADHANALNVTISDAGEAVRILGSSLVAYSYVQQESAGFRWPIEHTFVVRDTTSLSHIIPVTYKPNRLASRPQRTELLCNAHRVILSYPQELA